MFFVLILLLTNLLVVSFYCEYDILEYRYLYVLNAFLFFLFVCFCFQFVLGIFMKILESTILNTAAFPHVHRHPSIPFASAYFPNCTSLPFTIKTHTRYEIHTHSTTRRKHTTHTFTLSQLQFDQVAFRWKWMAKILQPERGDFLPGVFLFVLLLLSILSFPFLSCSHVSINVLLSTFLFPPLSCIFQVFICNRTSNDVTPTFLNRCTSFLAFFFINFALSKCVCSFSYFAFLNTYLFRL